MTPFDFRRAQRVRPDDRDMPPPVVTMEPAAPTLTSEAERLARLRGGDPIAYEELVRDETGHLLGVARRILRNEEDARDAVQQAFLSAFQALPAFHGRSRLTTWLHRIVTNAALMKLRARGRQMERSIEDLLPRFHADGHHIEQFSEWALPADTKMLRRETRAQVRAAIDELPESYRIVLVLRDIEELSTEEAAQALGVTSNTVKIRLHRARQALLTLLRPRMAMSEARAREPI